ncbi:diaminobutyrate acetyltransferase [Streptomyces xanthophaeus]|uniref:diaminobutyrate acetyltransferase n=1 Tax=Streptomyces xanthophaeus TaxID=67385 RepID=UPI00341CB193
MTPAPADLTRSRRGFLELPGELTLDSPNVEDGASLWRIARDSKVLDLNSAYSYLLWCRDFAGTSVVARDTSGRPVGFVSGYRRPDAPGNLFVWQVAVDAALRGQGVAGALLDGLSARVAGRHAGLRILETTIEPGNTASERLFVSYAERHGASLTRELLFAPGDFPGSDAHAAEVLHRITLPAP